MTPEKIEKLIREIENEMDAFQIKKENLEKFKENGPFDIECLSYLTAKESGYFKFLALLTKKLQPKTIVELGNREGLSTLSFYDQLPEDSTFTSIDILDDVRYCPDAMFTDPRVKFITGDVGSLDILKEVPDNIDILFTDTIHYYFQVKDEIEIYQHLLADTALVAIDDIRTNDKGKFWEEIQHPKWDLTELCHHSGWGLFLYERKVPLSTEEKQLAIAKATSTIWERKYTELLNKAEAADSKKMINILKREIKKHPTLYKMLVNLKNKYF